MNYIQLGERIREERLKLKLTQAGLAEKADISEAYAGQLERGERKPALETVVRLANVLEVSVDYLLKDSVEGSNENIVNQFRQLIYDMNIQNKQLIIEVNKTILSHFDKSRQIRGDMSYHIGNYPIEKELKAAKSEIFILGASQYINDLRFALDKIKKNVSITAAIPDYTNHDVLLTAKKIFWRSDADLSKRKTAFELGADYIKTERGRGIKIIELDTFLPYTIVAADYKKSDQNEKTSFILVGLHLLSSVKNKSKRHNYFLYPKDGEVFEDFRAQIELIEKFDGKLNNRLNKN
ncbi:MAG: helix-turn-helix domain-containing protein [Oscillospiraceae bacterium]|nr:helix-turn-helix domain-containing protein [Oscillospiraceae bacterium]